MPKPATVVYSRDPILLRELRGLVRRYLTETMFVPYRAIDCDQNAVDSLRAALARKSNWRGVLPPAYGFTKRGTKRATR